MHTFNAHVMTAKMVETHADAIEEIASDAVSQVLTSSGVVRMTGIALGCVGKTSAFGVVVRKAKISFVVSPSLTFRTEVHDVQMPAKNASGRLSCNANQTGSNVIGAFSEKLLKGTTQRLPTASHRRQWGAAQCGF
jgi:hypothetical protein